MIEKTNMRFLNIGETIKKSDEVNIQPFGEWEPKWEKLLASSAGK